MISSDLKITDILATFVHEPVNVIDGRPTFSTILKLQDQLAENAQCIPSPRSPIGHAGIVLPPQTYTQYAANPWSPPNAGVDPGDVVIYPPGALTPQQIKQCEQQHAGLKREYQIMKATDAALKKQIFEAIDTSFLVGVTFGTLGFGQRTALDVMTSLFQDFGRVTAIDIENNDKRMRREYNVDDPIEILFKQVDDAQKFAVACQNPHSNAQLVQCGEVHILRTQAYLEAFRAWKKVPANQRTWLQFKQNFLQASRERNEMLATTSQMGYQTANNVTSHDEDDTAHLDIAATQFAQASNAAQQSFLELTNNNSTLHNEIGNLRAQNQTLQAQFNVMQTQMQNVSLQNQQAHQAYSMPYPTPRNQAPPMMPPMNIPFNTPPPFNPNIMQQLRSRGRYRGWGRSGGCGRQQGGYQHYTPPMTQNTFGYTPPTMR